VAENAGVDITGPLNTFNGCGIDIVMRRAINAAIPAR
jgi:hypothetical protein